ncbi:MAG: site-specific DNA-methyltransferase [Chloroherpetonaceae bacterium]|nr:site-specific DNA-methyltransferase [Chloroherpetonaceae bacterium]
MTTHKIIFADSRRMLEVPNESVHLIVTSPPYWQLKDYGSPNQIGFNDSYEDYINNLNLVWKECYRVLHNGCRLCINIGDQFARAVYYGRYKVIPIHTEIIKFCEAIGFNYMGKIIWQKVTTCNTTGGAAVMGSFPYPRNGIVKIDYEYILLFKKGGAPPKVSREAKERSKLTPEEWNEYFSGHWTFSGERQDKHLAMFPEELPRRLIKMFSFVGETVLDPFLGSGTTSLAARRLRRHSIGYEVNEQFLPIIAEKLGIGQTDVFEQVSFEVLKPCREELDFSEHIKALPYVFKDPVKFNKKVDPRALSFGSRVSAEQIISPTEYLRLRTVLSPNLIELENGVVVRLIGVEAIEERAAEAMRFLEEKLRGESLFLKFDAVKYDENGTLLAYLYLKNKTFVNLHYLRTGLVRFSETFAIKYRDKLKAASPTGG